MVPLFGSPASLEWWDGLRLLVARAGGCGDLRAGLVGRSTAQGACGVVRGAMMGEAAEDQLGSPQLRIELAYGASFK